MDTSIDTLLSQNPSMTDGLKAFRQKGKSVIYGLSGSQKSFLLSRAVPEEQVQSIIIVVHDKEHKELWERDLAFFWPNVQVLPFPITERVEFTTVARSLEGQGAQMRALSMLAWNRPVVVLATIEEATQYVVSPQYVISQSVHLEVSQSIERDELLEKLVKIGYERVDQVEQRGSFFCARRYF